MNSVPKVEHRIIKLLEENMWENNAYLLKLN